MKGKEWFTLGSYESIKCLNCGTVHSDIASLDHHSGICPNCNIECIWFDLGNGKQIQVIPEFAPNPMREFIWWAQKELGELEFLELIVSLEEINSKLRELNN